jgi:hypothetical protein
MKKTFIPQVVSTAIQACLAIALLFSMGKSSAQVVAWDDSFDGASLNANLTQFTAGAGAGSSQSGGQLVMDVGVSNGSAQAAVNTTTDQTGTITTFNGEKLYNFYDHQVKARFDIASISGTNGGTGRNVFYFSIGDDAGGNYAPQSGVLDNGIGFSLEQVTATPYWRIYYLPLTNGDAGGGVVANISGVPTSLTYTLEGTEATIEMVGATITAVGSSGSGTVSGTDLTVALADLSSNVTGYTMAFGAYNWGNVGTKTVATLNSFEVTVIPEPSTWALLATSLTALVIFRRRRTPSTQS